MKDTKDQKVEQVRRGAFAKFVLLADKTLIWIEESLKSTKVCTYCDSKGVSSKVDSEGKCASCHGTNVVPNIDQRNWAAEQVADRVSPKPKSVEMQIDTSSDDAFSESLSKLDDSAVDELLKTMNIKCDGVDKQNGTDRK